MDTPTTVPPVKLEITLLDASEDIRLIQALMDTLEHFDNVTSSEEQERAVRYFYDCFSARA